MITIFNMLDMQQFGLTYLTGESCSYTMRVLWDLNDDGVELIADFLGIPHHAVYADEQCGTVVVPAKGMLAKNWNSMVGEKKAVASIMLPQAIIPELARFALFRHGCAVVFHAEAGGIYGMLPKELHMLENAKSAYAGTMHTNPFMRKEVEMRGDPATGRNVHLMSGRVK